jgi:hypothetical protein
MYNNSLSKEREKLIAEGYNSLIDLAEELSEDTGGPKKDTTLNSLIRMRHQFGLHPARVLGGTQSYYSREDIDCLREAWKRGEHLKHNPEERDAD